MAYGDIWMGRTVAFWDSMWERHADTPLVHRIRGMAMKADSIIEIGSGFGHFARDLVDHGWRGSSFLGIDIGDVTPECPDPRVAFARGDFMRLADDLREGPGEVDLVIAQGVLCHQAHWAPMTLAAMTLGASIALDLRYFRHEGPHDPTWFPRGYWDTYTSEAALLEELDAMALSRDIQCERYVQPTVQNRPAGLLVAGPLA